MFDSFKPLLFLAGASVSGGTAMIVAGSRMIQPFPYGNPTGANLILLGAILFGVSAGYIIREMQDMDFEDIDP